MAQRKKKAPEAPVKGSGDALFLELMMQMLAFFILLTSMAVIVDEKRLAALGSLAGTFSVLSKGANLSKGTGPSVPSRSVTKTTSTPKRTAKALTDLAKELGVEDSLHVLPLTKNEVRVRMNESILFASGSTALPAQADELMRRLAVLLKRPEVNQVVIQGHTDNTPASGQFRDNWQLSAARAMSVFRRFAELGMPAGRMVVQGMGPTHPIRDELGVVDGPKSRRVELVIRFRPVTDKTSDIKGVHGAPVQRPATAAGN